MLKKYIKALALLVALVMFYYWGKGSKPAAPPPQEVSLPKPPLPTPESEQLPSGNLIGEKLLRDYASEHTTLRDDLQGISRLSLSYITLVKNHANLPIGCNADLADAFRGENPHKQRFLPDTHPVFNAEGEIIDRWKTPLFIHPVSAGRWDIRSAGPDKKLWTADDLQLQADGEFIEGTPKTTLHGGIQPMPKRNK
ncbi:MAG: hypothetical protein AB8F34_01580 [Akkermansiaceae bacterium]